MSEVRCVSAIAPHRSHPAPLRIATDASCTTRLRDALIRARCRRVHPHILTTTPTYLLFCLLLPSSAFLFCLPQPADKKKRTFRKFSYRGIDLENLLDLSNEQLIELVQARVRRRLRQRGVRRKHIALIKKLRKAVRLSACLPPPTRALLYCTRPESSLSRAPALAISLSRSLARYHHHPHVLGALLQRKDVGVGAKPATVKTHLRNMLVVPEMIGSVVGVYNGKSFTQVEVKVRVALKQTESRERAHRHAAYAVLSEERHDEGRRGGRRVRVDRFGS